MKHPRLAMLTAGFLASVASCSADTIVSYLDNAFTTGDITVDAGSSSLAYSAADANITASVLTNAVAAPTTAGFSTTVFNAYVKASATPSNSGASSTPWLTFNVHANTGYTMDLTALTFKFGGSNNNTSGSVTYTPAYVVSYSFDNFATAGISAGTGSATLTLAFGTTDISNTASIDLSSIAGIASSPTVSFRISLSDNSSSANISYRIDDLALTGAVAVSAVPEPSSYALMAGGFVLGLVAVRRRRV